MSNQFYPLTVRDIIKESDDCVSISFNVGDALQKAFSYKAGQYINLKTHINGEEVRRSYSICTAPHEDLLKVAVKKVDGGVFSTFANEQLKCGDTLDVMPPHGHFILPDNLDSIKNVVFYCAGSGITPVIALIKTLLKKNNDINVHLYYGNKNTESIIYREELESLKNSHLLQFSLHYILSREVLSSPLFYGRIDGQKCLQFEKIFNNCIDHSIYYLCGPAPMVFDIKESLIKLGITEANVHHELFNTQGIIAEKSENVVVHQGSKLTIKLDELQIEFPYDMRYGSILDAALANGADLPYACKGGVCSTCKGKCESGTVSMKVNYALEPDELAAGYVLTCQSVPTSDHVFINFDS